MIQTGILPLSGVINFSFNEESLTLVANKLSSYLNIEAILSSPEKKGESKKKVDIKITTVKPAGTYTSETSYGKVNANFMEMRKVVGIARAETYFLDNVIFRNAWLLFGELQGPKKIPICIIYIPIFGMGSYSLKKDSENLSEFDPTLN